MGKESLREQARRLKEAIPFVRRDGRRADEPRPLQITTEYTKHAEGSVLVQSGDTQVICTASVEDKVPPFLRGTGKGWVTAEYGMLPRATNTRTGREVNFGKPSGRTAEIQRLIGRSLRSVVDLKLIGEVSIWVDCDVIQADGGTRTAAITGGFVALVLALRELGRTRSFARPPVSRYLSAISVGLISRQPLLDLNYEEDSQAEVDLNVVMSEDKDLVEIQGTAEDEPFPRILLENLLDLAEIGIEHHTRAQREALGDKLV